MFIVSLFHLLLYNMYLSTAIRSESILFHVCDALDIILNRHFIYLLGRVSECFPFLVWVFSCFALGNQKNIRSSDVL